MGLAPESRGRGGPAGSVAGSGDPREGGGECPREREGDLARRWGECVVRGVTKVREEGGGVPVKKAGGIKGGRVEL